MSPAIYLEPGATLAASAMFLTAGTLFVSIMGPSAVAFSSLWPSGTKEITNGSHDLWRLSVRASRGGPIGSEVPVYAMHQSANVTVFSVGTPTAPPEAVLVCAVTAGAPP